MILEVDKKSEVEPTESLFSVVFNTVIPILEGSVNLLKISQHVQPITRSILELFCAIAGSFYDRF